MNYNEFIELSKSNISFEDYEIIEKVYMNHPIINNFNGKRQIIDLFKLGGMILIKDMAKRCDAILTITEQINNIKETVFDLKSQRDIEIANIEAKYEEEISKYDKRVKELEKEIENLNK